MRVKDEAAASGEAHVARGGSSARADSAERVAPHLLPHRGGAPRLLEEHALRPGLDGGNNQQGSHEHRGQRVPSSERARGGRGCASDGTRRGLLPTGSQTAKPPTSKRPFETPLIITRPPRPPRRRGNPPPDVQCVVDGAIAKRGVPDVLRHGRLLSVQPVAQSAVVIIDRAQSIRASHQVGPNLACARIEKRRGR